MATTSFTSPSLISLAAIIVCTVVALSYAGPAVSPSPATTSKAIIRREADLTSEQIRSVVEVKIGVSVMKRLVDINLGRLPTELYGTNTTLHERGMIGFTTLLQYTMMFNALETLGYNSTNLVLYRAVIEQILSDACNWITSYSSTSIDCSNPTDFLGVLIGLGLNSQVDQLDCYLTKAVDTSYESMRRQPWVNKTMAGEYEDLRCPFCESIGLRRCCAI